jgi:hypothetical protein
VGPESQLGYRFRDGKGGTRPESEACLRIHFGSKPRTAVVGKKMQRLVMIAKHPLVDRTCSTARARKNYQRLFYRYREIAEEIGLHEFSAF